MADLNIGAGEEVTLNTEIRYDSIFMGEGSTLTVDGVLVASDFLQMGNGTLLRITNGGTYELDNWVNHGTDVTFEIVGSSTLDFHGSSTGGGGGFNGTTVIFSGEGGGTFNIPPGIQDLEVQGYGPGDILHF